MRRPVPNISVYQRRYQRISASNSFTLIELLLSIAIATVITAAVYFSLNTALESWGYSRDQLALQKVLSEVMDEVLSGTAAVYGLRDSLEIMAAGTNKVEFVPPWTDDTHSVAAMGFIYTLNRRIKPGAAVPIGEIKLSESGKYQFMPVSLVESEDANISQVRLGLAAQVGNHLRFIYHPDPRANPDVVQTISWDPEAQQVYSEDTEGIENISRNPFDVKITNMRLHYYDNANNLITDFEWVDDRDLNMITGIEVYMEVELGQYKQDLVSFINLRNAPMRSGYLALRKGTRIPIPDSHNIHTLLLTNISGVTSGDELQIEATPRSGKVWRVKIVFSRAGSSKPKIESYTVEYPPQHVVYTEYPRTSIDAGLNFLTLGANGFYDYDDDVDIEDFVMLEDEVVLEVTKMDIEGAGLFVRP
ncbi:MAG: prepilin-type N-terminal cleavage/methylation domain-containing protein [Candidatus Omnitrophica bacterium]|nr:prepilin-type N-terminal cleavage/methylation domain-containing protein [Candidatus Omnitrophota bacterium]